MEMAIARRGDIPGVVVRFDEGKVVSVRFVLRGKPKSGNQNLLREERGFAGRLKRDFEDYFGGERVEFDYEVEPESGTGFQRDVWRAMREIPYGETRTYGWIAQKIGKPGAARAVGNACGANPLPIIQPCHRVVASDGSPGGFSGGIPLKLKLLRLEGIDYKGRGPEKEK